MYAIKIEVTGNIAKITERPAKITTGTVGLPVVFSFDSQWAGLSKTAVFHAGHITKIKENLESETTVPWELLVFPNEWLSIGVYGVNADGSVAITTAWANVRIICDGANPRCDVSTAPSLPIWQKILNSIGSLIGLTTNAKSNLVDAINEVHNIALSGGIETDTTLLESGKAAEAKATGDAIRERVSKSGDTMTGNLVVPNLIVKNDTLWQRVGMRSANRPEVEANISYATDEDGTILYFDVRQNGIIEHFLLPRYDTSRTGVGWYNILTTKKAVAVEEGGTGARDATTARANLGAAPGGFGLGTFSTLRSWDEIDDLIKNGWYTLSGKEQNFDGVRTGYAYMQVESYDANWLTQTLHLIVVSGTAGLVLKRSRENGTWKQWEWENPPMMPGVEYRTTKRWYGAPVYVKRVDFGFVAPGASTSKTHSEYTIHPIHCYGWGSGNALPYFSSDQNYNILIGASGQTVNVSVGSAYTENIDIQVVVEYAKG